MPSVCFVSPTFCCEQKQHDGPATAAILVATGTASLAHCFSMATHQHSSPVHHQESPADLSTAIGNLRFISASCPCEVVLWPGRVHSRQLRWAHNKRHESGAVLRSVSLLLPTRRFYLTYIIQAHRWHEPANGNIVEALRRHVLLGRPELRDRWLVMHGGDRACQASMD